MGIEHVQSAIDDAHLVEVPPTPAGQNDPEPGGYHNGVAPGEWQPDDWGLPDDCPVKCLGVKGDTYFFLDTLKQLRALPAEKFSKGNLASLFMDRGMYLLWAWPRVKAKGDPDTFCADKVRDALMAACARRGPWDPSERVRGRGAWLSPRGELIFHTGGELWIAGRKHDVGLLGGYVYPAARGVWAPHERMIDADNAEHPARILVPLLRRWNWQRPDVDPILMLGWIVSAYLGGALDWRSFVFLTGDKGTGKSTLQAIVKGLFGEGIISTTNTTAAGIYQALGQDSLPVALDEFESDENNKRAMQVIDLARQSSSGGVGMRGGDRGVGSSFKSQSSFFFSSINAPPLAPQDLSRVALLRLEKISRDAKPIAISASDLGDLGRRIVRVVADNWHRFGPTLAAIKEELAEAGHEQRGQDTYGTLLACASLLCGDLAEDVDVPLGEDLTPWRTLLKASEISEVAGAVENWRACLSHLLGAPVHAYRGGARITVGAVLEAFYSGKDQDGHDSSMSMGDARKQLQLAGVGLLKPRERGQGYRILIQNHNPLLAELFNGSVWGGARGAGVWAQALQQGPRGHVWEFAAGRVAGVHKRGLAIDVEALYGPNGIMSGEDDEI